VVLLIQNVQRGYCKNFSERTEPQKGVKDQMPRIIFHGHSCFEIKGRNANIIIDPFLSNNPISKTKPEDINNISAILVTHGHEDHLGDTIEIAERNNAQVVAPAELARYLTHKGVNAHRMHIGGAHNFSWGWVKLTLALHGSGLDDGKNIIYLGNPCGFFLNIDNKIIYHAGDTGLFSDMKIFRDILGGKEINVAMLPIGDNVVMGPEDALLATKWIEPKVVIPMHYDTFPILKQDAYLFQKNIESQTSTKAIVLSPGEAFTV